MPLPPGCGNLDGPCCPANTDNRVTEVSVSNTSEAVPFCKDDKSMCVWQFDDYAEHGTRSFPAQDPTRPRQPYPWDGYFERGFGRSRCAPEPELCGNPGEPCCPSMVDIRISGMVHNRIYDDQPCNYRAVGREGIFCKGFWQRELLLKGTVLGVCTANPVGCGKQVGKACCVSDIPEVGQVGQCMTNRPPGDFYCTEGNNVCAVCPGANATRTPYEISNCRGFF